MKEGFLPIAVLAMAGVVAVTGASQLCFGGEEPVRFDKALSQQNGALRERERESSFGNYERACVQSDWLLLSLHAQL